MEWPVKTLGDVCIVERGSSPRPIQDFQTDSEDGVNWIKIGDTKGVTKYLTNTKEKITREGAKKSRLVEKGDFILSNSMSFGKPYIMATSGYIHDGWFALRLPEDIDPDFFYHLLSSPLVQDQFQSLSSGAIVKNISGDLVKKTRLPIPPISEQKRIVAILDQTFADIEQARAKTEQNLKNARELFESYLQQVFSERGEGWVTSKLKTITFKIGSGATPRGGNESYKQEGVPLIRSMNVHDRFFKNKNLAFIDDQQAGKLNNVIVEKGDVLLNITGASVARCCVAPDEFLPARVNQHVAIIRVDQSVLTSKFLNFILTSKFYKDQLLGIGESGSTRQAITKVQIEDFEIDFPCSIELQNQLLSSLRFLEDKTIAVQEIYKNKLIALDELKKSILQKAFTGQLTNKKGKGVAA